MMDETPIMQGVRYGIQAPNPHNTQAWKIRPLSPTEMLLYVDEGRTLPVTDPPARQIHIGCGCFIEVLAIGMSGHGYATRVDYLPEGPYGLKDVGRKPVARVSVHRTAGAPSDNLARFITLRQTNRKVYSGPLLTDEEARRLRHRVGPGDVELMIMNRDSQMRPFFDIFLHAVEIEARTRRTWEETRIWFRYSERQRRQRRDGLSVPQAGIDGLARLLAERYLRAGDPRRWFSPRYVESGLRAFAKGIFSARGLVFLKTATNTQLDWLLAGRAFARVHLALTELGMHCQPNSQVLQEFPEMAQLQADFNKMLAVAETEKIQMAVRAGRARQSYAAPRRDPWDLIVR